MRIRERMEARGILPVQLADAMSVSPGAVNKWVYGKANPSADKLPALAGLLGCTIDELFGQGGPSQAAGQPGRA